jgi:broad specificity phosphatase PhoE
VVVNGEEGRIMDFWLVRHGTTGANLQGRLQGRLDFPLADEGKIEVSMLARRLRGQRFSYLFCSTLGRARETVSIIADQVLGPEPIFTSLLEEYAWGVIQGMTKVEIGKRYPLILKQLQHDFHHAKIPEAEGISTLFQRVKLFYLLLSKIARKIPGGKERAPILIVSHGRFLQALIIYILKFNCGESWPFSLAPASLSILQDDFRGKRRLKLFNDTCHLCGEDRKMKI